MTVMTTRAAHGARWFARIAVAVAAAGAGCAHPTQSMPSEPAADWLAPHEPWQAGQPSARVPFKDPDEARYHMRMHFDDLRMVERLLVAGRLDEGRSLAYLLTRRSSDAGLTKWEAQSERVSAAALELTRTTTVNDALRQLAQVAVACGGCHVAARGTPAFPSPPLPADLPTPEARMARHAWAADRLWTGVVAAEDARWRSGLTVLAEAPLPAAVLPDHRSAGTALQAYAREQLDVRGATLLEDHGHAYGEVLVLCARCHAARGK